MEDAVEGLIPLSVVPPAPLAWPHTPPPVPLPSLSESKEEVEYANSAPLPVAVPDDEDEDEDVPTLPNTYESTEGS